MPGMLANLLTESSLACRFDANKRVRSMSLKPFALVKPFRRLSAAPQSETESRPVPLWLCAYLDRLPLEVLGLPDDHSAAVVEESKGRPWIRVVSSRAAEKGAAPGMPLSAAYALCPELRIESRDREREWQALQRLAQYSLDFTPWVSLDLPQSLLLEVRGSLNLFGGLRALTAKFKEILAARGYRASCAATPAPFASWLLACNAREHDVQQPEELRSALGDLPSAVLGVDARTHERLLKAGLSTLCDLWRLPRDGLARRYGPQVLDLLDRATGSRATPLSRFHSPPSFRSLLELPAETDRLAYFFPAIELLIGRLTEFLAARDAAVTQILLTLGHRGHPSTLLRQGSRRPTRKSTHLALLLRERLERLSLPAPVCSLELHSQAIIPWAMVSADLFAEKASGPAEWHELLDQLQARLGPKALQRLQARGDHRPELAGHRIDGSEAMIPAPEPRPLWLLPRPRALSRHDLCHILPETERIEGGWWDQETTRRDYHIAIDRQGARLWVYRDLQAPERWYLHGLFG